MYSVVIFDDDPKQCGYIAELVERCSVDTDRPFLASSEEELETLFKREGRIDIFIMDIYLEGKNDSGIDIAKRILLRESGAQIIYITGFIEYCEAVYETEHVSFLKKPIDEKRLDEAMIRAVKTLEKYRRNTIPIVKKSDIINVCVHDICYMESSGRKLKYVLRNIQYEAYGKISEAQRQLDREFVRCHKSYLVNMACVKELSGNSLILDNDEIIPVSRSCREQTKKRLFQYLSM